MRTLILGCVILALLVPAAMAGTRGHPNTAHVQAAAGTVNYNTGTVAVPIWTAVTPGANPSGAVTVLPKAIVPGDVEGIQMAINSALTVEYRFGNSPLSSPNPGGEIGYSNQASIINLAIYFGDGPTGVNSIDLGTLQLISISYSTDAGATFSLAQPITQLLPRLGLTAPQPSTAYLLNIGNPPNTTVDVVRILYTTGAGAGATFWLAGLQNPEPATFALFGLGILGAGTLVLRRRRRRRKL